MKRSVLIHLCYFRYLLLKTPLYSVSHLSALCAFARVTPTWLRLAALSSS